MALVGCGSLLEEPALDAASELVLAYDRVGGVSDLQVESGLDERGGSYVETVVTLAEDATPAQVTSLVDTHAERVNAAGLPAAPEYRTLRIAFTDPDSPTLSVDWKGGTSPSVIAPGVERWFAVSDLLGVGVQMVLGTDGSELYGVPAEGAAVDAVFRTLRSQPAVAAPEAVWDVTGQDGDTALRVSVNGLPSERQLDAWGDLVAALAGLPAEHPARRLEVNLSDRATVQLDLAAPTGTTVADFPYAEHRDTLWPVIEAHLDVVPTLKQTWDYAIDVAPAQDPSTFTRLLGLSSTTPPEDTGTRSSRWSLRAHAYLENDGPDDARSDR